MGALWYGISLQMFNLLSREREQRKSKVSSKRIWTVIISWYRDKHEKRSSISASDHVLFCLSRKYNRPLLGRKVDFLKNEIIGFTIRTIKKSYSASAIKLKMKKSVEPLQKQTMGVAFFSQNSQLLTFSLPTKEIFSCSRPKSACGKSFSCRFSFSATRNTNTQVKDLTLGFSLRILFYFPYLEILSDSVC